MNFLKIFKNKSILITGGTGSFGRKMAQKLLAESDCRKVVIFSRDEWKQWEMRQSLPIFDHPKIRYFLGDVRDANRLKRAFNEIDFVIHAAALKQVPAAEYNPSEFIKTNVNGAMNVIDEAINCRVEKVVALSTDKAVNPINLYGASKLCSDRLFIAANAYVGSSGKPRLSIVRYGNVLGSRGSVIPLWDNLIRSGAKALPITDERMTRFWITLDHAVDFVIQAFNDMRGGEIYVPKIPSLYLKDLASAMAPKLEKTYVGIREGEKLHELLVGQDDARHTYEYKDHYMIVPENYSCNPPFLEQYLEGRKGGKLPKEGFSFASDTNQRWLSLEELRRVLPYARSDAF